MTTYSVYYRHNGKKRWDKSGPYYGDYLSEFDALNRAEEIGGWYEASFSMP